MSLCDDKKFAVDFTKEERLSLETDLVFGIRQMIGLPIDKSSNKEFNKAEANREKKRYKEHKKLYDYLIDSSKEYLYAINNPFVVPAEAVEMRLKWIQGVFQEAYFQSAFADPANPFMAGLNNHNEWDHGKIRYIRNKMSGWEKRAGKGGLTQYENTIKKPILVARSLDPSGYTSSFVKMTEELLDSYLQRGYGWKYSIVDPITGKKNPISLGEIDERLGQVSARGSVAELTNNENSLAPIQLMDELIHNEVRNIIPINISTDPEQFIKWRNSWAGKRFFKQMSAGESERHEIGDSDSRYVMIPLHSNDTGKKILRNYRKNQIKENILSKELDPGENENAYLVYRIPDNLDSFFKDIKKNKLITKEILEKHLLPTELEAGFFTANDHRVYKYESMDENNIVPKRKYADWTSGVKLENKTYQPLDEWMPELWETIKMQRDWYKVFFDKVLKKDTKESLEELQFYIKSFTRRAIKSGWPEEDVQELLEKINSLGGISFNIFEDDQGNFISSNMFARKASEWSYGNVKFYDIVYQTMLEKAYKVITKSYLPEIEAQLAVDENVMKSEESDSMEKAESSERISELKDKREFYEEMISNMHTRLYGKDDGDADKNEMIMSNRVLATKARTLFTDHKQRRKDREVPKEYVDQAMRALELVKLKTMLYKAIGAMHHNPKLVDWMVDHAKVAYGDVDIESGIGPIPSDQSVAKYLPERWTAENVRDSNLIWRGYKTGANLGTFTTVPNNLQRLNGVINYGYKNTYNSMRALSSRDENNVSADSIWQQVEETGVLHPGNAFVDMLTMGMTLEGDSDWKEGLMPLVDIARLFKTVVLSDWIDQSSSWDRLITNARKRSTEEAITTQELKRVKEELHRIVHGSYTKEDEKRLRKRFLDLKIGLGLKTVNRLVKWKLEWFPFAAAEEFLTMKGSEARMRAEFAHMGFINAYNHGMVYVPPDKQGWKYTDSPDAVDEARVYVYHNLFGLTKVISPKAMRGGFGGTFFQWKPYEYNQVIVEMEILRSVALSSEWVEERGWDPKYGWGSLPFRISFQIAKKVLRGGSQSARAFGFSKDQIHYWQRMFKLNKELDDKNLDRAVNFLLIRGVASVGMKLLFMKAWPYTILKSYQGLVRPFFRSKVNVRGLSGLESPLISRTLNIAIFLAILLQAMTGEEEEEFEDILRDWTPSEIVTLYLWILDFGENFWRGSKVYLPTPIDILSPGGPADEIWETVDDYLSF